MPYDATPLTPMRVAIATLVGNNYPTIVLENQIQIN